MLSLSIQNRCGFAVKPVELKFLKSHLPMPRGALQCSLAIDFYKICKIKVFECKWIKTIVFFHSHPLSVQCPVGHCLRALRHCWDPVKGELSWSHLRPVLTEIPLCGSQPLLCVLLCLLAVPLWRWPPGIPSPLGWLTRCPDTKFRDRGGLTTELVLGFLA